MAKYDPLKRYLRRQSADEVLLTFPEIENLLAAMLPNSARRPEWWANARVGTPPPVQSMAWLAAGYEAFPVVDRERVTFRKPR